MFWGNGQPLLVEGALQAVFSFPGGRNLSYSGTFLVSRHLCKPLQCILGWDFLTTNCLSLTSQGNGAYYLTGKHGDTALTPQDEFSAFSVPTSLNDSPDGTPVPVLFIQSQNKGPVPITLSASTCIPSRAEVIVTGKLPKRYKDEIGMVSPVIKDCLPTHLMVAYSVCQADKRNIPVRIMNSSNIALQLESGQQICEFCPLVDNISPPSLHSAIDSNPCLLCNSSTSSNVENDLSAALSSSLDEHERTVIFNTLLKFSDVCNESLGQTQVISHLINTGDAAPIRQPPPRRLPYAFREEAQSQVRNMLEQGVIQPSASPWASPIVLVKKKDGKYRFCVDYRKLNSVTQKDAHPLPRIDDLLDSLHGSVMFSTLDLRSGYWQINMHPNDREKTAFATPNGLWEFLRMPFGLSNACVTFQRALEIVLSGLTLDTCLCYFDDIIIPSNSLEQQCERLSTVLTRFRQHKLRVKASKCCFGADKVSYLDHIVSSEGVHTDPTKIQAVLQPSLLHRVRHGLTQIDYCLFWSSLSIVITAGNFNYCNDTFMVK